MSQTAIIYWSGTGNTEQMAYAVMEGIKEKAAEAALFAASEFGASMVKQYDAIAFGCPAMGAEVLEETEFQPMWDACEGALGGKKVALFGSYGWGDGEWMRSWEDACGSAGAVLACESVICNEAPNEEALEACRALGGALC